MDGESLTGFRTSKKKKKERKRNLKAPPGAAKGLCQVIPVIGPMWALSDAPVTTAEE